MDHLAELIQKPEFAVFARDVFEALPFFIAIDAESRIVYINQQYAASLGIPQEEMIGRQVGEILPWSELPQVVRTGETKTNCIHVYYPDRGLAQESRNVCSRVPVHRGGTTVGAVGITSFTSFQQLFAVAEEAMKLQKQGKESQRDQIVARMIGQSDGMKELRRTIERVANSDISVCITGETGVGKELVADAIHAYSQRKNAPFVKINCAAIPKELMEAELFGYAPGAFTGANRLGRKGKFELANGGTILLDEIGEMSLELQSKLLRVLQERQIEPVGSNRPVSLNIRVISSTNRNLWQMVDEGAFRQDLFYRLNTMELAVPPLRARLEDLPLLCGHFIAACNLSNGTNILHMSENAYDVLRSYPWPGNVRELQHAIDRACILKQEGELEGEDFAFLLSRMAKSPDASGLTQPTQLKQSVEQAEKEAILAALIKAKGNKSAAARALGIDRTALYAKIKRYQINLNL